MDPLTGVSVAKSVDAAGQEGARLVSRVLGPSADVLGVALAGWTQRRVENVSSIARRAERKSHGRQGTVNARVAHQVMDDGSYVDDEVMAEYYAGILASSKSPDGRDDMGQPWVALVSTLSSAQIRLHYVLYRAWARHLAGTSIRLTHGDGRREAFLRADIGDVLAAIGSINTDVNGVLNHSVSGLVRSGLLSEDYSWGPPQDHASPWRSELVVIPTPAGMDLYGWAIGNGMTSPSAFTTLSDRNEVIEGMPELTDVEVPNAAAHRAEDT